MNVHALAIAREQLADAIKSLQTAEALLIAAEAPGLAHEVASSTAIVEMDLVVVTRSWDEAKSEAGTAGV